MRKTKRVRFAKKLTKTYYTRKSYYKGGVRKKSPKKKSPKKKSPKKKSPKKKAPKMTHAAWVKFVKTANKIEDINQTIEGKMKRIKWLEGRAGREKKKMKKKKIVKRTHRRVTGCKGHKRKVCRKNKKCKMTKKGKRKSYCRSRTCHRLSKRGGWRWPWNKDRSTPAEVNLGLGEYLSNSEKQRLEEAHRQANRSHHGTSEALAAYRGRHPSNEGDQSDALDHVPLGRDADWPFCRVAVSGIPASARGSR